MGSGKRPFPDGCTVLLVVISASNSTLDTLPLQWKIWMDKKSLYSSLARLKRYSLLGWFRWFRLKMQGKAVVIEGSCLMCGRCCRRVSLEAGGRWLRNEADFRRVLKRNPEYGRFKPVDRDSQGFLLFSCSWYQPEGGICSDHENRLPVCRNFPDKDLYFTGGEVSEGCGYRFREVVPFASILHTEMTADDGGEKTTSRD